MVHSEWKSDYFVKSDTSSPRHKNKNHRTSLLLLVLWCTGDFTQDETKTTTEWRYLLITVSLKSIFEYAKKMLRTRWLICIVGLRTMDTFCSVILFCFSCSTWNQRSHMQTQSSDRQHDIKNNFKIPFSVIYTSLSCSKAWLRRANK